MNNYQLSINNYPLYKDSGVEWLGDVPEHWEVRRIKNVYQCFGSGSTPESGEPKYYENGTISWLNTTDLKNSNITETSKKITRLALREKSLRIYPIGTLAIAMYGQGDTRGNVGILGIEATTNQAACMMYRSSNSIPKYMLLWFISKKTDIREINVGATQPNMNKDFVRNLFIALPPLYEQKAIADYLDTKTAQIDRKIDLLSQKAKLYSNLKQSLINETVTRGLDKSVPMKDSGIEWIGEVPQHWNIKRLKDMANQSKEKNGTHPVGKMLSVSGYRGIEIKQYDDDIKKRTDEELSDYRVVRVGQLVVNTMWLNYRGIGVSNYEGHVSPAYRAYFLRKNSNGSFIHYLVRSDLYVFGYSKYLQGIRPNSLQMKTIDFECLPNRNRSERVNSYGGNREGGVVPLRLALTASVINSKTSRF